MVVDSVVCSLTRLTSGVPLSVRTAFGSIAAECTIVGMFSANEPWKLPPVPEWKTLAAVPAPASAFVSKVSADAGASMVTPFAVKLTAPPTCAVVVILAMSIATATPMPVAVRSTEWASAVVGAVVSPAACTVMVPVPSHTAPVPTHRPKDPVAGAM
ncbi:hypothetical protein GCM10023087_34780 [Microbacterium rhizosphaerae]